MAKTERELTVQERRSIRKLVTGCCAKGEDFFTTEGIVTDKDRLLRDVFDDIKEHLTGGLVTKAKNLLEAIRMECYDRGDLEKYQDSGRKRWHFLCVGV